jgi:hypothetical protein
MTASTPLRVLVYGSREKRFMLAPGAWTIAVPVLRACTTDDLSLVDWVVGLGGLGTIAATGPGLGRFRGAADMARQARAAGVPVVGVGEGGRQ